MTKRPVKVALWSLLIAAQFCLLSMVIAFSGAATAPPGPLGRDEERTSSAAGTSKALDDLQATIGRLRREAALPYEIMRLQDCRIELKMIRADLKRSTNMLFQHMASQLDMPPTFRAYQPLGQIFIAARTKASQCLRASFSDDIFAEIGPKLDAPAPGEPEDSANQVYRYRKTYIQFSEIDRSIERFLSMLEIRRATLRRELMN